MFRSLKPLICLFGYLILALGLTGCPGGSSSSTSDSAKIETSQPAASSGNFAFAVNDEVPVIRNNSGQPILIEAEAAREVIHYDGVAKEGEVN